MNVLIVDGYNIIGAWPALRRLKEEGDLAAARDLLIDKLADYKGFTGDHVVVVFDAHLVQGNEKKYKNYDIDVIFTKENETADERIERLAKTLINARTKVYVATSDYTEQWTVFGQGALRKSARELLHEIEEVERDISKKLQSMKQHTPTLKVPLNDRVVEIFEKWRRGQK
ncbi:NYN domain-containing protein [Geobacillus stearothermophilus]|uniref:NYN domain-containing protein n=1 Tax=Geobacillus stearothermophilus TaxID=1422 RepID=UPI002E1D4577|nr:NYN domain-containing protein [Geobacillus stearothermophilus]MED4355495.1 NYN domain-containing protein [Geobacillus stearothermophilus]